MSTLPKGSKYCGELHRHVDSAVEAKMEKVEPLVVGMIYKRPTGDFVVVQKAELSGNILNVSDPLPGNAFKKYRVDQLGYATVNCYRMR